MPIKLPLGTQIPSTSFGDVRSAELFPVAGWTFNYNINSDLVKTTLTGSGTATADNSMALIQTGTESTSLAKIETIRALRYTPGLGGLLRFTAIFTKGVANSSQIIGIGDDLDGFFFGYNGSSFAILRRQNGTNNWIPQSIWNSDKFDGTGFSNVTLNPTQGNVYTIQYQWLGFGNIDFFIEHPGTGEPTLVHTIQYTNANTIPSILNPTLPVMAEVINTTNTSNIALRSSSAMGMVEGNANTDAITTRNSFANTKTGISTTEISIFTLQNKTTFQSKTNRVRVRFDFISYIGTQQTIFRLTKNASLGGTPVFTDISTNTSVIAVDSDGTTVTGGTRIFSFAFSGIASEQTSLLEFNLELSPGDTFTLSAQSNAATTDATIGISWKECW
ncbi:hypothetical protein SAMN05444672_103167 [Bacillus sp. OK838]|nr:hypothetical protein SAMN05444672_103167 [Bacillus sp. OK838]